MSSETEEAHIRVTCPHCRRQFQRTAAWISANDYVRCDFCREPIGLKPYKRQAAVAKVPDSAAANAKPDASPAPAAKPEIPPKATAAAKKTAAPAARKRKPAAVANKKSAKAKR
jgi:hypothetical protein